MLPLVYPSDREAVDAALQTIGLIEPPEARIVHIRDTLHLGEVEVSEACLPEIRASERCRILEGPFEIPWDSDGNLQPV